MNDMISKFTDLPRPAGSSVLGHALIGLAILVVGLIIVNFIAGIFRRLLKKVSMLHRTNADAGLPGQGGAAASRFD